MNGKVVLVVLNYNDYITTRNFVNTIKNYNNIYKIVVVDNCSSDNSFIELQKIVSEKIYLIKSSKNGGYAYGNNVGIKYAIRNFKPEYIIISNPDVYFIDSILNEMINIYNEIDKVGIVTPKMICNKNSVIAWKLPKFSNNIIQLFEVIKKIFGNQLKYENNHFISNYTLVDVVPGSFFMICLKALVDIEYFDEETFLYMEENILAYKLKEKHYKTILLNNISYIHEHSVSIDKSYNNIVKKYKLLINSMKIYNYKYLKINFMQRGIFSGLALLSILEKYIIYYIRKLFY